MDELVIFTSPLMCVMIGVILLLHIAAAVSGTLIKSKKGERITVYTLSAVNLCLHAVVFVWGLVKSASPEELLLFLTASGAVGIVAMGISEKLINKKKESR